MRDLLAALGYLVLLLTIGALFVPEVGVLYQLLTNH